jgi:hypothetical protein
LGERAVRAMFVVVLDELDDHRLQRAPIDS